jgi:hypothetical protein
MANEFIARNGLLALNNSQITGSLTVSNGITGSFFGTASYAAQALSSSYALTASYALNGGGGSTIVTGSNATLNQSSAATTWSFTHNLNTQYPVFQVFDSNNNVVIPQSIIATNTTTATIYFPTAIAGTAVASIGGYTGSATTAISASYAATASFASSFTASNATITGNLGVGTASPSYNLDVTGTGRFTDALSLNGGNNGLIIYQNGGAPGLATYSANADRAQFAFKYAQNFPGSNNYTRLLDIVSTGDSTGGGAIRFLTTVNNSTPSASMYISPSGNVGIGTTSPIQPLQVNGTALVSGSSYGIVQVKGSGASTWQMFANPSDQMRFGISGVGDYMTITNGGNVLIGTATDYGSKLHVNGVISSKTAGADATYNPSFVGLYTGNDVESNAISTTVSSVAAQSGFRFDVSNGGGSASRTASMYVNRTSVTIVGSLSKGSGSFRIKHPLVSKKATHQLVHSFIEGPQADLIYRGKVRLTGGRAVVNIDEAATMTEGTFEILCREIQCFTSNETSWDAVRGKVEGNILTIECQNTESTDEISWLVIGERQDEHMYETDWTDSDGKVIVEPLISEENK